MADTIIGNRKIGPDSPPFIVAEMSGNHNQSLERALQIVEAAAQAGTEKLRPKPVVRSCGPSQW